MSPHALVIRAVAAFLAGLSLAAMSCSSTDDDPTFDTDGGDQLARAMLPEPAVFPGSGWQFTETDPDESDDDDAVAGTCEALAGGLKNLEAEVGEPAGNAAGSYTLAADDDDPSAIPVEVQVEVEIHEERDDVRRGLEAFSELISGPDFEECIQEAFRQGASESDPPQGLEVKFETSAPSASSPRGGAERAFLGEVSFGQQKLEFRMEMYAWRIGNAVEFVFVSGDEESITGTFVKNVLDRLDGAALAAADAD